MDSELKGDGEAGGSYYMRMPECDTNVGGSGGSLHSSGGIGLNNCGLDGPEFSPVANPLQVGPQLYLGSGGGSGVKGCTVDGKGIRTIFVFQ
jgi:hypothetical protein